MNTQNTAGSHSRIVGWLASILTAGTLGHAATAVAAGGIIPVGPTITIDTLVSSDGSYDHSATAAVAADGTAVVAWMVQSNIYLDNYIVARRIAADGTPLTPDILVDNTPGNFSQEGDPVVASDSAGNFVVVWSGFGTSGAAAYRLFAADGTPRTAATCVAADCSAQGARGITDVSMDNAGDFAVLALVQKSGYLYFFHPDGSAGAVQAVPQASGTTMWSGSISKNRQNGNVDVAWLQGKQLHNGGLYYKYRYQAYQQRYGADGSVLRYPIQEASCTETAYINGKYYGCEIYSTSVAQDDAGNEMVAWHQDGFSKGTTSSETIYARTYGPTGALITGKTAITPPSTSTAWVSGLLNVRATGPASFAVAWASIDSTDPSNPRVPLNLVSLGLNEQANGPAIQSWIPGMSGGSIATNGAGNVFGDWVTNAGDGINSGVIGQFYQQQ